MSSVLYLPTEIGAEEGGEEFLLRDAIANLECENGRGGFL